IRVQHRPPDHRGLRQHQLDGFASVQSFLLLVRQFAKRRTGPIQQRLPPECLAPDLQPAAVDAGFLVVVECVGDTVLVKPGKRLLRRVAVFDAVDRGGHSKELPAEAAAGSRYPDFTRGASPSSGAPPTSAGSPPALLPTA